MLMLPQGPWDLLISGNWDGIDTTYYQNSEKEVLILIFDKKEEKILGQVMLLARFFVTDQDVSRLVDSFSEGNLVYLKKKTKTTKFNYLAVVTDPVYARFKGPEILKKFNEAYTSLNQACVELRNLARKQNIVLTELKNAGEEKIHRLFGEPLALPTVIVRKPGEKTILEMKTGKLYLGLRLTGERAETIAQNLILATIIGSSYKRILQVLLEESVLNGIVPILYDETGEFEEINKPNPDTSEYQKFEISQPMGMPTRTMEPGIEIFIDISHFDAELLGELLGLGGDSIQVLDDALKSEPENLDELMQAIEKTTQKKYAHERVLRLLTLVKRLYGDLFKGKNDAREILAPWLKKMGRITYIPLKEVPDQFRPGIRFSVTKSIHRFLKSELTTREINSLTVLESGKGKIYSETLKTLKVLTNYGHGLILVGESESDLDKEVLQNAKIRIDIIDENEVSIEEHGKKPSRIRVRPTLATFSG